MGGLQPRAIWAVTAALATVIVAATVVFARVHGLTADDQFRLWLERQPGVVSIDRFTPRHPDSGDRVEAGTVPSPSAEVTFTGPLTATRLRPFQRAFEDYAAGHGQDFFSFSVQLTAGATTVVVTPSAADNARRRTVLEAFQSVPGLVGARLAWMPWPAETTALLPDEASLPAAAEAVSRRLAATTPQPQTWGEPVGDGTLSFRAAGTRHQLTLVPGTAFAPHALRAFAAAVRIEGARPVELRVSGPREAAPPWTRLLLSRDSPTVGATNTAVSALGFGIPAHHEYLIGGQDVGYRPAFDLGAWSARTLPAVRRVPGVAAAALRLSVAPQEGSATLDVRLSRPGALARLVPVLPDGVDAVRAWTGTTPPDEVRSDEASPDPPQGCGTGGQGVDTAYEGPAAGLTRAAALMERLAATRQPTCLHWAVAYGDLSGTQVLDVWLPELRDSAWRPVLDVVLASRRDPAQAHPQVAVELPGPGKPWTALLLLHPDQAEPYATSRPGSPTEMRAATAALNPLVAYWAVHVGR
jgi:hypothetical protein